MNGETLESLAEPRPLAELPVVGYGHSTAHHGEILQGVFEGPDGVLCRGLVTLPCQMLRSFAVFTAEPGPLSIEPAWRVKAQKAARLTLERLGMGHTGGHLRVHSNI